VEVLGGEIDVPASIATFAKGSVEGEPPQHSHACHHRRWVSLW